MSQANFDDLEAVFEQPDGEFKANLPEVLDGAAENIEHLLALHPDAFETLSTRMSTLDDIGTYATEEPGTVKEFITVLWDGLSLVTEMVPAVSEEVTEEYAVNWKPTHSPASFHMTADPETGTVAGWPGLLDDRESGSRARPTSCSVCSTTTRSTRRSPMCKIATRSSARSNARGASTT